MVAVIQRLSSDDPSQERRSEIRALVPKAPEDRVVGSSVEAVPAILTGVVCEDLPPAWSAQVERLRHHRLVVVARGDVTVSTIDCSQSLGSKGCALVPRGNGYAESVGDRPPCSRFLIDFDDDLLPLVDPLFVEDSARRLLELAQWLLLEREASFQGSIEFRSQVLRLMLCELNRLVIDDASAIEKRVRNYVLCHVNQAITLADLAQHVGTSRFHLCRVYRRQTGESPMHAVRRVRLEVAREILKTTDLPLRDVASRVGLRSEQHLSRLLKTEFGLGAKAIRSGA